MSPDDIVLVDVTCRLGGECWTWGASSDLRRDVAELLIAKARTTLPDASFAVRVIQASEEVR